MRAIWSGALSFGLVNIPVKLYSASVEREIKLHFLHKEDLSPIHYARVCAAEEKEVPYEDIVKGYDYGGGNYVILTDQDFQKANVHAAKTIEILDFAAQKQIDPVFYEKPYFLEPEKGSAKAYALLREAINKSKKVAIAKFVLRNREHLGAILPRGKALVLNQMRFLEEIREDEDLKLPANTAIKDKEMDVALSLIERLSGPFKPQEYKDTYAGELRQIIEEKAKGKKPKPKGKAPQATEVTDLMAMLQASLRKEKRHEKQKQHAR